MRFWQGGAVQDLLVLAALLLVGRTLSLSVPALRRLALPDALVAGALGLALGGAGLGWLSLGADTLELVVYHALAVVYIAMGLTPAPPNPMPGARAWAIAHPLLTALQLSGGLLVAVALGAHPGLGALLPLGFSQGPGQALSIGASWEEAGLEAGGQAGLLVAALGYASCLALGVVAVQVGRARGWVQPAPPVAVAAEGASSEEAGAGLEPLSVQLALVGGVYLLTWLALSGLAGLLAEKPKLVAMLFGFHWIIGLLLALALRFALGARLRGVVDGRLMGATAGVAVDFGAAAAIAAVQVGAVGALLGPAIAVSLLGALVTGLGCVWLAKRLFPVQPFEHALVLFGALTGTLPTGLALLRILDPKLESPAARNAILGASGSVALAAPIFLVMVPWAVVIRPGDALGAAGMGIAWAALMVGLGVWWGDLRLRPEAPRG
jgi:ESS family glutamate:Na+ symporter